MISSADMVALLIVTGMVIVVFCLAFWDGGRRQ